MATVISGDTGVSQVQDGVIQTADIAPLAVTPEKMSQKLTLATAQNTTSGTAIDFTSIPSWVKRITVMFNGVSASGTSIPQIQLGDSGGVETSGYSAMATTVTTASNTTRGTAATSGFILNYVSGASETLSGLVAFALLGSNVWTVSGALYNAAVGGLITVSGVKTLTDTLDRIRLTTVNGTDTFDAGSVNILYEG